VLNHGTSIGGARPKALITDGTKKYVAKFSSSNDLYSVVGAEFVAMRLAELVGISVAPVQLIEAAGRQVLLVERFDRIAQSGGWTRKGMVSGLTILGLSELNARYASYEDLATEVRWNFTASTATLAELFKRLVFNILVGNTDDHARNHAAFWDGQRLSLTPAYDICPQARTGREATQAMLIRGSDRSSRISSCLQAAHQFLLSEEQAISIIESLLDVIGEHFIAVAAEACVSPKDRAILAGNQFLNPLSTECLTGDAGRLRLRAEEVRREIM